MANVPGNVEWVTKLIPEMDVRRDQFIVDTDEVDDELMEIFFDELQRLTGELKDGLEKKDSEMVRRAAHSIKGMGGTIGLPEISVLALEVENLINENQMPKAQPLVNGLAHWLTTLNA